MTFWMSSDRFVSFFYDLLPIKMFSFKTEFLKLNLKKKNTNLECFVLVQILYPNVTDK